MTRIKHLQRFKKNELGKDYAIGDIHGCVSLLMDALKRVGFNTDTDRLFSVGDLVDRGEENLMALPLLKQNWFHAVRGNHEQLHIDQEHLTYSNGCDWIEHLSDSEKVQYQEMIEWFKDLPLMIDVELDYGLVGIIHAEVPHHLMNWIDCANYVNELKPHKLKVSDAMWGRTRLRQLEIYGKGFDQGVYGVEFVVCGHTPQSFPLMFGNHLNIDTGISLHNHYRYKWDHDKLCLLNLTDRQFHCFKISENQIVSDCETSDVIYDYS